MSLFKSASTVSLLTLASRITGLGRELLMASLFGASAMTDAFNVAFRIPNLFRRLFGEGAFSQAFVPVLAASKAQHGEEATKQLIDRVASVLSFVLVLLCIAGVIAAPLMVWVMASGLQQEAAGFDAAVVMTRWMFPYIGCMSLVALASGILNTWKRFAAPAATPVLLNLSMMGAAWLGAPWFEAHGIEPIYALAGGVMLGGLLQLGAQIPVLMSLGLMPRIRLGWSSVRAAWADPSARRIATLMTPALLGVGVAHISILINTQIASHLTPGSVSWLGYADRLMEFPTALLGVALGVVLMPQLSTAHAAGDTARYSSMLDWGLRLVVMMAVPSAVALLTFAEPLVATIYHHGAFRVEDVQQTSVALMGYGAGLFGLVAIKVLAPGFYAKQDVRTPVRIALFVLVCTQLFNIGLVPLLQHAGLALSIGLGATLNAALLLMGLMRSGSYQPAPGWGRFVLQVVAASALLAIFLIWASRAYDWTQTGHGWLRIGGMASVLAASALLYFGGIWAAGIKVRALLRHG